MTAADLKVRPTYKTTANLDTNRINAYTWIGASFDYGSFRVAIDDDLYFISVAARILGMHPQTLRKYERLGLVQPSRTIGSMRLYSREELARLKAIKRLVDDGGINLAGVQRLLSIAEVVQRIRPIVTSIREEAVTGRDARKLSQELEQLVRILELE
jgi:MerR family transcriptional regulator/heat shock protein HspR